MTVTGPAQAAPPRTAADVMVTRPKTLPVDVTVAHARAELADGHVHMLLLVDGKTLRGALVRGDLPADAHPDATALRYARLDGRTVAPGTDAETIRVALVASGRRRLAVVTASGRLLGLVCLKHSRTGFCSDEGVANRAAGRLDPC